jgi:hypothetical protein
VFFPADISFIQFLFESANPSHLDGSNFSRICRILAKVVGSAPRQHREAMTGRLTGLAAQFLESGDASQVELGTEMAWSIGSLSTCGSYLVTQCLWGPLLSALEATKAPELIAVFPSAIRTAPWGRCRKSCAAFLQIVLTIPDQDAAILDSYTQIVQCHHEFSDARDVVASAFAQKLIDQTPPCFFEFFKVCSVKDDEEHIVIQAACAALCHFDVDIARAAAGLLRRLVQKSRDGVFLRRWQEQMIRAVFVAFLERLHVGLLKALGNVLFFIFNKQIPDCAPEESVVEAISEAVDDRELCEAFAESLRGAAQDRGEFLQIIADFLVSAGRANPVDLRHFVDTMEITALARDIMGAMDPTQMVNEDEFGAKM